MPSRFFVTLRIADVCVVSTFLFTAAVAVAVWQLRDVEPVASLVGHFDKTKEREELTASRAQELIRDVRELSDAQLWNFAGDLVERATPSEVWSIGTHLIKGSREPKARRIAVFAAEIGGVKWQDSRLLFRAGVEYRRGRYVKRDYVKARRFLTDPALYNSFWGLFELGEYYLDISNPDFDHDRGVQLIRRAGELGHPDSASRLADLDREN